MLRQLIPWLPATLWVLVFNGTETIVSPNSLEKIVGGRDYYCIEAIEDPNGANCDVCKSDGQIWGMCLVTGVDYYWEQLPAGSTFNKATDSEVPCGGTYRRYTNNDCTNAYDMGVSCIRTRTIYTFTPISGPDCS